jgi:translation initiation factor 5A
MTSKQGENVFIVGKKYEDICPSTHNMDVPNVKRKDYQLIGMEDDFLSLMDDSGDTRDDLKCPEGEIGDEIRAAISEEKEILVS